MQIHIVIHRSPVRSNDVLRRLWSDFEKLYSHTGRPSIPPERLLRALLLQVLYSIRSERMLVEQMDYNLLFRWFVGLGMDEEVWHPTTFTQNRDRLLEQDAAEEVPVSRPASRFHSRSDDRLILRPVQNRFPALQAGTRAYVPNHG